MSLKFAQQFACFNIPQTQNLVEAARQGPAAIGREGDGANGIGMRAERTHLLAREQIVQSKPTGLSAGQGALAVRRECHRPDRAMMAAQLPDLLPGLQIPKANGAIVATGKNTAAVRRNGDAHNHIAMSLQRKTLSIQTMTDVVKHIAGAETYLQIRVFQRGTQTRQGGFADFTEPLTRPLALAEFAAA